MPFVNIITNVKLTEAKEDKVLADAHDIVKSVLGKPDAYICVNIQSGSNLIFAKKKDPAAMVQVEALGGGNNGSFCEKITKVLNTEAGISADRVFVNFTSFSGKDWGMGGSTFG